MPRLIPVVTLIDSQAVKTTNFRNPRYVGDPTNTVSLFSSYEVEELIVLDISNNFQETQTSQEVLTQLVENAFMPIAFGGGIQNAEFAKKIFDIGFDKIVLKSNLFDRDLVKEIAGSYGSQAVTGCLDIKFPMEDIQSVEVNGKNYNAEECERLIFEISELGVGELLIQDVQRDGTRLGLRNHFFLELAVQHLEFPVIPLGGCRDIQDAAAFVRDTKCHSVAASTMFLFRKKRDAILVTYPDVEQWHNELGKS